MLTLLHLSAGSRWLRLSVLIRWPLSGLSVTRCQRADQRPGPSSFKLETNKLGFFTGFTFHFFCKSWSQARDVKHYSWRTWARGWRIDSFLLSLNSKSHFRHPREQMPLGCSNVRLKLLTLWPASGFNYTVDLISKHIYLCFCFNSDAAVSF